MNSADFIKIFSCYAVFLIDLIIIEWKGIPMLGDTQQLIQWIANHRLAFDIPLYAYERRPMSKLMKTFGALSLFGLILSLLSMPVGAQPPAKARTAPGESPLAAQNPLTADGQMQISAQDRCPVCGMFPAKRPKTAAAMALADGRTFYFCGNGCLLRTWHAAPTYLNAPRETIQRMVARDYFSGAPIDAYKAWWVAGSDVIGPMGPAIVALQTEPAVTQFKTRHGGKKVFQMVDMDEALWNSLFPPKKK